MKLYGRAYLNNGTAFLSSVELDQPIDDVNEVTLGYIIATAYDCEIPFDFYEVNELNEEEFDEIEASERYSYFDLSEFGFDPLFVNLYDFKVIPLDKMIPDDAIHIRYRNLIGREFTTTREDDALSDIEISEIERNLKNETAFLMEYKSIDGSRVVFKDNGEIKLKGVKVYET